MLRSMREAHRRAASAGTACRWQVGSELVLLPVMPVLSPLVRHLRKTYVATQRSSQQGSMAYKDTVKGCREAPGKDKLLTT